jgi:hypothetical protein
LKPNLKASKLQVRPHAVEPAIEIRDLLPIEQKVWNTENQRRVWPRRLSCILP